MKRNYHNYFNWTILGLLLISSCYFIPSISCQDYEYNQSTEITAPQPSSSSTTSTTTQAPPVTATSSPGRNQIQSTTTTTPTNAVEKPTKKNNKSRFSMFSNGLTDSAPKQLPCPPACQCNENRTEVTCANSTLISVPQALKSFGNLTYLSLRNNSFEIFNLNWIPSDSLVTLDLSMNEIKNITSSSYKYKSKLANLNLSSNKLANLDNFKNLNMSALTNLDLSDNKLAKLDQLPFASLTILNLSRNPISSLGENAFANMTKLNTLVLDSALKPAAMTKMLNNGKIFESNWALTKLDLSNLELTEVPMSVRNAANLTTLILDKNRFTSLRPSDFRGLTNLTHLYIRQCPQLTCIDPFTFGDMKTLQILKLSHNPKLSDFSINAFINSENYNSQENYTSIDFEDVDLSYNNLSSLPNLLEAAPKVVINELKLNNNPWQCDCQIMWIQSIPMSKMSTLHCSLPENRKDLEIHAIQFEECRQPHGPGSHGSYHFLLTCIVLLLFAFVVAFILRKSQFCRRLLWRDQYGTIYYTKASFPAENA